MHLVSFITTTSISRSLVCRFTQRIDKMAAQSTGIQTLLEAEKEAAKIVQKARTYRTQKLKDARSEASKEIEELKKQKEEEFTKFQKENQGNQSESQTQIDKETQEKLQTINVG